MPAPKKKGLWIDAIVAFVALLVGGALAIVCLIFKPVVVVANDPSQSSEISGDVYYVQGSRDRAKGASWVRKRSALLAATPGTITLNEDELNTWFATSSHTRAARRAGISASAVELDFHVANHLLQVAAPVTVQTPLGARTVIVQMRGDFQRLPPGSLGGMGGVIMFSPRETYAGSLALHRIPGAMQHLVDTILETQTPPGEVLAALRKIERVTISGRELHVVVVATASAD